ncbi:MAG: hypothetical protein ACLU9S_09060 [Oscillospiraceae bacterium]
MERTRDTHDHGQRQPALRVYRRQHPEIVFPLGGIGTGSIGLGGNGRLTDWEYRRPPP